MPRDNLNRFIGLLLPFATDVQCVDEGRDLEMYTALFPVEPDEPPDYLAINWIHRESTDTFSAIAVRIADGEGGLYWHHMPEPRVNGGEFHYLNYVLDKREITITHGRVSVVLSLMAMANRLRNNDGTPLLFVVGRPAGDEDRFYSNNPLLIDLMIVAYRDRSATAPIIDLMHELPETTTIIDELARANR